MQKYDYDVVGKPLPRIDGRLKVTGTATYADDLLLPGMLHGKLLRSPYSHAKILNIDTTKADKLPGVRAVITGKEKGNGHPYGLYRDAFELNWRR
jgi:CO/xanthine dehydrogenase Mo-binding subunit